MRFVIQVVDTASVTIKEQNYTASIGQGLLVYVGIHKNDMSDYQEKIAHFVSKIRGLQLFHVEGKLQGSLSSEGGDILLISNFTLYGENRKGNRFDFGDSAGFADAQMVYDALVQEVTVGCADLRTQVQTGIFGAYMEVISTNAGPITFVFEE